MLEPAVVAVGHGDKLDAREPVLRLGISLALATGADQRDLDVIVGRDRLGRFRLGLSQQMGSRPSKVSTVAAAPAALRKFLRFKSSTVVLTAESYPPSVTIQLPASKGTASG